MDKFTAIIQHIRKVYLTYNRPFIIGYSGGKDSTLTLQLVWEAIEGLSRDHVKQSIYVISTDTLVETPIIRKYILNNIEKINIASQAKGLPIHAYLLTPRYEDSFWVNLIGKGYPAPSRMFRWCTERLKIAPVDSFIKEQVNKWGETTIVIGARGNESASRSQVLSKKVRDNLGLSKHPSLPAAYVFTPIEHLTTDDVWSYLIAEENKWGMDNNILKALYAKASGGECPMVLDKTTPSCGNSRFGCWVCTVVSKDISITNLIEAGEKWMTPLLEFRNLLASTQDPSVKHKYRSHKRRNGKITLVRDGSKISYGPYKFEWRQEFLKRLLLTQKIVRNIGPDPAYSLISLKELEIIRDIWRQEEHDWADTVPIIYREIVGEDIFNTKEDRSILNLEDFNLLRKICITENMPVELIAKLIDLEKKLSAMNQRASIMNKIDRIIGEDWRTEKEFIASLNINAAK